ncbi:hypothetical protein AL755_08225 [Arthrobacter sp. ERGS1:01]|uniref:hypothetical protein n=1 Tax=Arthrobacter sp. ERGS1:01 TaxID=1704044 RepID=UPI0006B66913|nr:hypothetical protein [Arthrobacter sp. ERGS1:01]ALE05467.1 hypothetical protein AL755_08225 [Arthrobacter sp. ERGS1:01]
MSQLATRIAPITVGNNARALSMPLEELGAPLPATGAPAPRPRTPLSLVVSSPRKNKTPLLVSLFLLLVAALSAVLIMSVSVSQGQYDLVGLKDQQSALQKSNQALELQLSAEEAPQSLVARAAGMGMVPAATTGQIDVRTKKVTGNPQPAVPETKGLVALAPAQVNPPTPDAAVNPNAADAGSAAQDGNAVAAAEKAAAKAGGTKAAPAPLAAAPNAAELNGGTIPAPAQKDN